MSEEEDLVGADIDRAIRAAMMGAGQVAEAVKRAGQERDRALAERAQAAVRDQAQVTRSVRDQVGRDTFWDTATGERIANAATYGATLSNVDPGARDIYEIVREQTHQRYGVDLDSLRAKFPDSEDRRRDALMHAVDDYLAASREEAAARADRAAAAAALEREGDDAERAEVGDDGAATTPDALEDAEARQSAQEAAQDATADAAGHEGERDRLHAEGAAEESVAHTHEQESRLTARAAAPREASAAIAGDPTASGARTSAAARVSKVAATSYPKGASQTLTESRRTAAPKARVNRSTGPQKDRGKDLGR